MRRGCGSDSTDSEQTESLNEDTGEDTTYNPNEEGRGGSGGSIHVTTWKTANYTNDYTRLYARKDTTSKWDILLDSGVGDNEIYIDDDYVEFGFEFSIYGGTKWPYTGVFWTAEDSAREKVKDIYIKMDGTVRYSEIYISVNDKMVVSDDDLWSQEQHHWDTEIPIKVEMNHSGWYVVDLKQFYGRTDSGRQITIFEGGNGNYTINVGRNYVDFGFKFSIAWNGTPYNKIFWYKNEHPNDIVEEISINTSGVVFLGSPYIEIEVKGRKDGTGDTVRLYYEESKLNKNDRL